MVRKLVYFTLFILITFNLKAEGYRILLHWEGLADTTVLLAHYYDTSFPINDTIYLDKNGKGEVKGDSLLHQGLYMMFLNEKNYFDFLLGEDQTLEISTKSPDIYANLKIKGAPESEAFVDYLHKFRKKNEEKTALLADLKSTDSTLIKKSRERLRDLDKEMTELINQEIKTAGNSMFGVFLNLSNKVVIPEPPVSKDNPQYDSIAWFHGYFYNRDHYWDGINFKDDRVLYTPIFKNKFDTYFNNVLIQAPDSIIPQAIKVIRMAEGNETMYRYISQSLLNNAITSKIMGMDAVFVAVADEVYLKGKATWADSTVLAKIAEEAYLTRPNLIGKKAPELTMENINGEYESLYLSQGDYTILVFYEYDCGHCKKDIPALYNDVYMKFLDYNIEVYAVCMNDDHEKWEKFVEDNGLAGWHHLWDPNHYSKFRFKYHTKTAPTLYLLDKDKIIRAKKIDNSSLTKLLTALLKEK